MTNAASITVTPEDREEILSAIWYRNSVRRGASLPLLDVKVEFDREVTRLATRHYLKVLQPYLLLALTEIGGHPGIAGRLVQRLKGTQIARRRLREDTGIDHPDHGLSMSTGSEWFQTMLGIEKAEGVPVFSLQDAPHRSW